MPTDGMRTMISTKLAVVVAMLALTGAVAAQEVVDEDRIARLVEELMEIDDRSEVTHELVAIGLEQREAKVLADGDRARRWSGLCAERGSEGTRLAARHRARAGA